MNRRRQIWHSKGRAPVCTSKCRLRRLEKENSFSHFLQRYTLVPAVVTSSSVNSSSVKPVSLGRTGRPGAQEKKKRHHTLDNIQYCLWRQCAVETKSVGCEHFSGTLLDCGPRTYTPLGSSVWVRVRLGSGIASGKGWVGTWPVNRLDPFYVRLRECVPHILTPLFQMDEQRWGWWWRLATLLLEDAGSQL